MTRIVLFFGVASFGLIVFWLVLSGENNVNEPVLSREFPAPPVLESSMLPSASNFPITTSVESGVVITSKEVLQEVPFTAQAPIGNWDDPIYQNACEEASVLMAMRWVSGKSLTTQEAMTEIKDMSEYTLKEFGHYRDVSAADTVRLISDYYGYSNVRLVPDIGAKDIKQELQQGNLVIVPVNGQKLPNPFYVPPGPLEHMLVVRGYDTATDQFITNDPGTRRGEGFRYEASVLEVALRDYSTGFHESAGDVNKVMIIVGPKLTR